ncbi:MAG: hypothetical protein ACRCX8_06555 [Sarcina sp.]
MAVQIESDSKLQFYPTGYKETIRAMCVLGGLYINNTQQIKEKIGEKKYTEIREEWFNNRKNNKFDNFILDYLLEKNMYEVIEKNFYSTFSNATVSDLFAGEGSWLRLYKKFIKRDIQLIGNELEFNRYEKMKMDVDYHFNLAFEELQLPKRSINIMLFNPPYGISNGERNVRRYLRMILERELITKDGYIIAALKTEDILNCSDLFTEYFQVERMVAYKTDKEEFEKFGQQMLFLKIREKKIDLKTSSGVIHFKGAKEKFENYIGQEIEFQDFFNYKWRYINFNEIDVELAFNNLKHIQDNRKKLSSKKSKAIRWIIDDTRVKDLSEEIINIPKPLKAGELANVIASGKINGEMSLNGDGWHIACGGVKDLMEQRKIDIENKKGEMETKQETILKSEPYLNILINNNGKLEIKELKSGGIKDDTISNEQRRKYYNG